VSVYGPPFLIYLISHAVRVISRVSRPLLFLITVPGGYKYGDLALQAEGV
jgi:hypothetical protein